MKSLKLLLFLIFLIIIILFIILFIGLIKPIKTQENFEDDIFYTSKLRLMDYQDIISSTESQLIKNTK